MYHLTNILSYNHFKYNEYFFPLNIYYTTVIFWESDNLNQEIVQTNTPCTYNYFLNCLHNLKEAFPFITLKVIGKSVMGKSIYAINLGCGERKILTCGAHHANEWITCTLLLKFAHNYLNAYQNDGYIFGESVRE